MRSDYSMKNYLLLCAFLLVSTLSYSQYQISGSIIDTTGAVVPYASIGLALPEDSTVVQFAVSTDKGKFSIKGVDGGSYLLVSASYGYDVHYLPLRVESDLKDVVVKMNNSSISFEEVMVRAAHIPILINGDTVVYNSESYQTGNNASVEDLLKKCPVFRSIRTAV